MFEALEKIPLNELELRWTRARKILGELSPQAGGLLVFSRPAVYYLSGTLGNGLFWLPLEGAPVLLLRRGLERAGLESAAPNIFSFRSYSDVPGILKDAGSPLGKSVAAEMGGLSWSLANMLTQRLPEYEFISGDKVLALTRSVKTNWELVKMRLCGERHKISLAQILPRHIRPGMSEREISHKAWEVFFSQGHSGLMRMNTLGEEIFLGHVAAGDSGNYPSVFNGPVGLRGEHPAVPFMGYAGKIWQPGEPLACDIGFCLEGYITDKTQVYWGGPKSSIPERALSAHALCVDMHLWLAENARPGALPSELYTHCVDWAEREGFGEGFLALGKNKVFFVGHGIGMAVDEYPPLAKGFDAPLEEGMVLALEPKIGIPGLGMVGVEDTFEVTKTKARCLTADHFEMICVQE